MKTINHKTHYPYVQNKMSNIINPSSNAALAGQGTFVFKANVDKLVENADGSVSLEAGTQGANDQTFKLNIVAFETAADQLKAEKQKAKAKGSQIMRAMVVGPLEVDIEENALGKDVPLALNVNAIMARPVHPNEAVEPLQNNCVVMGRVVKTKFANGSEKVELQFGHLASAIEEGSAPAAVKLSGGTVKLLSDHDGQDVQLCGAFTRYTAEKADGDIPAHDSVSFAASSGQLIQIAGGRTRYQPKKQNKSNVITASYEDGYEAQVDQASVKSDLADLDF